MMIKNLIQTCLACPSQWNAETEDGKTVYIRFRWGQLTVSVGNDMKAALNSKPIFDKEISDDLDGFITEKDMLRETGLTLRG